MVFYFFFDKIIYFAYGCVLSVNYLCEKGKVVKTKKGRFPDDPFSLFAYCYLHSYYFISA
jgi:hypothetical protein